METSQTGKPRLKTLWRLSWPAIIEQILTTMVSYVDPAMVGVLGAAGTAAVSVNGTTRGPGGSSARGCWPPSWWASWAC